MSQVKVGIVEGWSGPLDFELLNDGAIQNLTSMTVTGQAFNRLKQAVTLTSDVTILSATDGQVRLTPDTGDFVESGSPYELRFKVVDGSSQIVFFPSDEPISLIVRR
jgi:hypothetical protein